MRVPEQAGLRLAALARGVPFRAAVALALLATHLALMIHSGATRFGVPFNAAPGQAPKFNNPAVEAVPQHWNRLVVSRWDAGQYIELGLRGYRYCPPRDPTGKIPPRMGTCNLSFYPTYGLMGRLATFGGRIAIDYALFAISLVASFLFLFLWTSDALVKRLGLAETYLSLLLFNAFTTGFSLVSIQTEPTTLALTLGAFVAFQKRWYWLAAVLAGATSGMRITGVATSAACALALAVETWRERPRTPAAWAARAAMILLCGWGALVLMGYHHHRFGDAFAYIHTHGRDFKHDPSVAKLLSPKPEWLIHSMEQPLHEGVWLVAGVLWFLIGHRQALRKFPPAEQAFWYGLFVACIAIVTVGGVQISFAGMNRYLLLCLPIFFAMASVMRTRPLLLAFWLVVSVWHYWHVDMCTYTGGMGNRVLEICHTPHWIGRI